MLDNYQQAWDYATAIADLKKVENWVNDYDHRIAEFNSDKLELLSTQWWIEYIIKQDSTIKGGWDTFWHNVRLGVITILACSAVQLVYPQQVDNILAEVNHQTHLV